MKNLNDFGNKNLPAYLAAYANNAIGFETCCRFIACCFDRVDGLSPYDIGYGDAVDGYKFHPYTSALIHGQIERLAYTDGFNAGRADH